MTAPASLIDAILQRPGGLGSVADLPDPAELAHEIAHLAGASGDGPALEKQLHVLGHVLDYLRGTDFEVWKRELRKQLSDREAQAPVSWPPEIQALERELALEDQRCVRLARDKAGALEALTEVKRLEEDRARLLARRAALHASLESYPQPATLS